jgi:toluene monooxygenase system protein E
VVTSKLLYYPGRGFEVATPVAQWYQRHQIDSPLRCSDWECFADPRRTTYARYTALQRDKETFVERLLATIAGTDYDRLLPRPWLSIVARVVAPLRYPCHALQMLAAYVAQMAPSGRITVAAMFQAADEMRRVHRLAYRLRMLQHSHAGLGDDSRQLWQADPLWQPLRETTERLLCTYDWGECFTALCLVLKPMLDDLWMVHLARLARRHGDDVLERLFASLDEDCRWHRAWSQALVATALADTPANREVMEQWIAVWRPRALEAAGALRPAFEEMAAPGAAVDFSGVLAAVDESNVSLHSALGLAGGGR